MTMRPRRPWNIWRGEILARAGRPESALSVYRKLIEPDAKGAELALDAAETMLDNGHLDRGQSALEHGMRPGTPPKPTPPLDQPPRERLARPSFLNNRARLL